MAPPAVEAPAMPPLAPPVAPSIEPAPAPDVVAPPAVEPEVPTTTVVTPQREWGAVRATVTQGSSFTIIGSDYRPGQQIIINMGIYQSDGMVMDEQVAIADAAGNYSFTILVGADLPPRAYGVLTYHADAPGGPEREASKTKAIIDVVAP
ncbi:hypothetical protein [Arthrobacter sp. L77]|uniref:hypothetical protein n=1 Tax=Arthrobacter sp. L77 TaxID=1496689 RepID=UPI0012DFEC09|nr:hypothetical protein [Arthrobacter sp. L77]